MLGALNEFQNRLFHRLGPGHRPEDAPPDEFQGPLLVLCGAREGHGLPSLPGPWLEAIHEQHPVLYMAGAPDAAQLAPKTARGWYLPGLSPALLGMLLTTADV